MLAFPLCKINLGLSVIEKRNDGYHTIETVFYPIPLTDILEVLHSTKLTFSATGTPIPGDSNNNLCLKAYHLLEQDFSLSPVAIHLHKVIPTGAGLGGGSADAAYTLRLLNSLFELSLSKTQLQHYAQQLGSDCAFFLEDEAMLGTGRGELLQPIKLSLKGKYLVLLKPPIHVSTAEAYQGVKPQVCTPSIATVVEQMAIDEWKNFLKNDFELSVFEHYPKIASYKAMLYEQGAIYASMSGSGSSVFGIFDQAIQIRSSDVIWSGYLTT